MFTSIIYSITNEINGKNYIGYTERNLSDRKAGHKWSAFKLNIDSKLYRALRKYGWDNFKWEVIYCSWDNKHCLEVVEDMLIREHNSIMSGYNTKGGGDSPPPKQLGSKNVNFGKKMSDEERYRLSNYVKSNVKGKTYSEIYGEERAREIVNSKLNHLRTVNIGRKSPRKGVSLEQEYGLERAQEIRDKIRSKPKRVGENATNYDKTNYTFTHTITNESFTGTRQAFAKKYNIEANMLYSLINSRCKTYKKWRLG